MKQYGSVVLLALGDAPVNALVVQSVPQADGEHLVCFYLDPAHEATAMGGQSVDAAIKKDFVTPLTDGKKFGWKDLPESVLPTGYGPEEVDGKHGPLLVDFDDLLALSNTVGTIAPNMEISPSGTIISANTLLQEILLRKPEPAPPQEAASDEPSPNLKAAAAIIEQQGLLIKTHRQKIADLEAELEGVKTELATTTEGIDKQLQGIADATAAKEAAPEATADPTLLTSQTSPESDSPPTGQDAIPKDSTTEPE
jgi:hypothetical protein